MTHDEAVDAFRPETEKPVETSHCELCREARTVWPSGAITETHLQWCSELRRVSRQALELQNEIDRLQRRDKEREEDVADLRDGLVHLQKRLDELDELKPVRGGLDLSGNSSEPNREPNA